MGKQQVDWIVPQFRGSTGTLMCAALEIIEL